MAFLDFGTTSGLAYRYSADKDIDEANKMYIMKRQARIDQENKAALMGEKFKFGHVDNPYNEQRLNEYTEKRMTEIGKFVHDNPQFQTNPAQLALFNRMTNSLLDNPIVSEDMRVKAHRDAQLKYIHETPGAEDFDSIQKQNQEYENYSKTGSITGNSADRKEFMFYNPDDLINTGNAIQDVFGAIKANHTIKGANGSYERVAYNEDLQAGADQVLRHAPTRAKLTKEWNEAQQDPEFKKIGINNLRDYVIHLGKKNVKTEYEGEKPGFLDRSGGGAGNNYPYGTPDPWKEKYNSWAIGAKNMASTGAGNSFAGSLSPEDQANLFGVSQNGKTVMTIRGGTIRGKDGTQLDALPLNGSYNVIPTGEVRTDYIAPSQKGGKEQYRFYHRAQVIVPYAEAYRLMKEKMIGGPDYFNENATTTFNNESFKTGEINLNEAGARYFNLHDDNGRPAVGMYVDIPFDPDEIGLGEKFNHQVLGAPGNQFSTDTRNYPGFQQQQASSYLSAAQNAIVGKTNDNEVVDVMGAKHTVGEYKQILKNAGF